MFIALGDNGERVTIEKAIKGEKYTCPTCNSELIQKRGAVNIHHFAHIADGDCDTWGEMTEWHLMWQSHFKEQYREVVLGEHRADIKIENYIIEFQKSPIGEEELRERINFYTTHGKLIFLFDLREKQIHRRTSRRNTFSWKYPSRTIIPPNNENYFLFFQIADNSILFIKNPIDTWADFKIYKTLTKVQFVNLFKENNTIKIFKALCEKDEDVETQSGEYSRKARRLFERIDELEKELAAAKEEYSVASSIHLERIQLSDNYASQLTERIIKQAEHIKELKHDIEQLEESKIVEKIIEVEVPVVKEIQVEKLVPLKLNKKHVVDATILELGRYLSCATTNTDREKTYPRKLFEERLKKVIDVAYESKG